MAIVIIVIVIVIVVVVVCTVINAFTVKIKKAASYHLAIVMV